MARSKTAQSSAGHRSFHRLAREDSGFTLVEVLVALTLFMIVSAASIWWLVETMKLTNSIRDRVAGASLATQELEKIRAERNSGQELDSGTTTVSLHDMTFSVQALLNPANTASCATGQSRQVTVVVTWPTSSTGIKLTSELAC